MSASRTTRIVVFQLYYFSLAILVVLFWTCYFISVFSYRKKAIDGTPLANFLRILPGNIRLFSSGYNVNIILTSIGSATAFFFGIFLQILYLWCDEGKLWWYNAKTDSVHLPQTMLHGLSAVKRSNGFIRNLLLTVFLPGEFIFHFMTDLARSIHSRMLPGNIRLFGTGYYVNVIFVSIGSTYILSTGTFLHLIYLRYDKGKLWGHHAVTYNLYLPKTIQDGLPEQNRTNGFVPNFLLVILLSGDIIVNLIADVTRSIYSLGPKNIASLKIRRENGESLNATLRDNTVPVPEDGQEKHCGEYRIDEYYVRIGLHQICGEGKRHGGVNDVQTAKRILRIVDQFEKQEILMYSLANAGLTQAALGMSIMEYSDISGADIYTRFAILLAVFTISYSAGPFLKSPTYDRLKEEMNEYIIEKQKSEPQDILQANFVSIV